MSRSLTYQIPLEEIATMLDKDVNIVDEETPKLLTLSGELIKSKVITLLNRSTKQTNYDGTPRVHMQDDVQVRLRETKKTKTKYVSVGGGFYTGYKWHIVDRGWANRSGEFIEGNHFMDKAVAQTDNEIMSSVDNLCKEVVKNG